MPYLISDPPDRIKGLPKPAQEIWIKAFNAAIKQYDGDEEKANAVAWSAVKKAGYKKVGDKWVAPNTQDYELPKTFDIEGVEIFAAGKPNGHTYTEKDLEEMVKGFYETKSILKPYLKLGHDDNQKLAQRSGMPALGWIENLRKKGKKLVADFVKVPKKIYDLIKAGAYRRISSEIFWNIPVAGKTYRRLLKAVALLGADTPAVGNLNDIINLYSIPVMEPYETDSEFQEYEFAIDGISIKEQQLFVCECIKCGYQMQTDQHCDQISCPKCGGTMRRLERPGPGKNNIKEDQMAKWSVAFINDLPDSSFAYIKPGGKKDEEGKTVPRSLRYLPYKDANGKIDLPHLRNALARLPQTNLTPAEKAKARAVLVKAAKAAGVGEYELEKFLEEVKKMERIEELQAKIDKLQEEKAAAEKEAEEAKKQAEEAEKKAKEAEEAKNKIEQEVAEKAEKELKASIEATVDKLIQDKHLLPVHKEALVDILFDLKKSSEVKKYKINEKEEKSADEIILNIVSNQFVDLNTTDASETGVPLTDEEGELTHQKALKYAKEHKVSYKEALLHVASSKQ